MFSKIGAAVLLNAMIFLSAACERSEIGERFYLNYEQLATSDEPGNWVPSFIPHSAVEIKTRYKIDTGAELLTFYYGEPNELSLAGYCNQVLASDVELPSSRFLDVTWWPDSLSRDRTKNEGLAWYEFYRCERQTFLALKRDGRHQAFYWRISLH